MRTGLVGYKINRDDIIRIACEVYGDASWNDAQVARLEQFVELIATPQQKRADAFAETINALREVVTCQFETKEQFISRIKAILSDCPDTRVLQAVLDERETCARLCEEVGRIVDGLTPKDCADAIRARGL